MGIDIVCLTVDWESAVSGYREHGLDFYWNACQAREERFQAASSALPDSPELDELPGLPGAEDPDLWCGTRAFYLVADFYEDAFRPALTDELRRMCEPVLPLLALCDDIPVPFDRQCLLADAGLTEPVAWSKPLYALRPSVVHEVVDAARSLRWSELDAFADEIAPFEGYDFFLLQSFARLQLDRLREAARRGHGAVLILSV